MGPDQTADERTALESQITADLRVLTAESEQIGRAFAVVHDDRVAYSAVTTGLERYRLPYNALTQTSLAHIDLATQFLGGSLQAPILIGAMTGGAELSGTINKNLAAAAQHLGLGMMLGSQRIMLEQAGRFLGWPCAADRLVRIDRPAHRAGQHLLDQTGRCGVGAHLVEQHILRPAAKPVVK